MRGQHHAPAGPYPRERPGTHCTGGWVGLRASLDRCEKSRPPTGIRSPDRPARRQSLYRLRYPAHPPHTAKVKKCDVTSMQPSNVGNFIKMKSHSYYWSNWLILRGMRKGKQNKITYNIQITYIKLSKVQITSQAVKVDTFQASFKPYGLFQFGIHFWHSDLHRLLVGCLGGEVVITRPLKTKNAENKIWTQNSNIQIVLYVP